MARKGLGKGLSALLGDYDIETDDNQIELESQPQQQQQQQQSQMQHITRKVAFDERTLPQSESPANEIPIFLIDRNENQPRKKFDEVALSELTNSIRLYGVLTPILVAPRNGRYMIIAGERRWRAAKNAGLLSIPCVVKNYTEQQIKEIALIENLQREELNPIDTANAIKQLMDEYKYTQEEIADRIGKSRPAVANTLRLLSLSKRVSDMVANGDLSPGHARCLIVVDNADDQFNLASMAIKGRISVRDLEKKVKEYFKPKPKQSDLAHSLELRDLIDRMKRVFSTKVSLIGNEKKGRIFIDYYNSDDLDRLLELVCVLEERQN